MLDVTLEELEKICGKPKKQGQEYLFPCPSCQKLGHDRKGDNLSFNPQKGTLKCFARGCEKEILSMINRGRGYTGAVHHSAPPVRVNNEPKIKKWELNKEKYLQYQSLVNSELLQMPKASQYLEEQRGIKKNTVDLCGLGYDYDSCNWVFPIYSMKEKCIISFEYRPKDLTNKKIIRESGGETCIAMIYGKEEAQDLFICEGFLDSYLFVQYMLEQNQSDFAVVSCSSGVESLKYVINEINFSKYQNIKLLLDNDPAGDKMTKYLIEMFPFMQDRRFLLGEYNDFSDWYMAQNS